MSYDSNVYYHPEKHGLKVVAEIEYSDLSYVFDTRVVWKHMLSGLLYTARDAGCSCPTPFEDYNAVSDLERVDDIIRLRAEIREELAKEYGGINITASDGQAFLRKVVDALSDPTPDQVDVLIVTDMPDYATIASVPGGSEIVANAETIIAVNSDGAPRIIKHRDKADEATVVTARYKS